MALRKLLITGAVERANAFELGDGRYYGRACLAELDLATGVFRSILEKSDGGSHYPDEHPNQQFTVPCLDGDSVWLPTDTEIFHYSLPNFALKQYFSHACFHNIHSVHVFGDELAVSNTGLDTIVFLNKETGDIKTMVHAEGKDPWHRFSPEQDYRKTHSTRPHSSHPNHVLKVAHEYWVTRCTQGDVVKLSDPSVSIDISDNGDVSVHDGLVWRDKVIFTRVDGLLALCDASTMRRETYLDPFADSPNRPLGWCRGLHVANDIAYIGFSRLRKTRLASKLRYLSKGNFKFHAGNAAMVVAFDLNSQQVLRWYDAPEQMLHAIYGVIPFHYE